MQWASLLLPALLPALLGRVLGLTRRSLARPSVRPSAGMESWTDGPTERARCMQRAAADCRVAALGAVAVNPTQVCMEDGGGPSSTIGRGCLNAATTKTKMSKK